VNERPPITASRNFLLAGLSPSDFALLQPHLVQTRLASKEVLVEANRPIDEVLFLEDGVASIVQTFDNGSETEIGVVGREGIAGISVLLRSQQSPNRIYMQIDGSSVIRIGTHAFLQAVEQSQTLAAKLLAYVQTLLAQTGHTAAINARFTLPVRLARWLLMCHDRVDGDDIRVTHDVMATMLGVRRPGVTQALSNLEDIGSVRGHRARVEILDRALLEKYAGSAYGAPEVEYRRLIGSFGKSVEPSVALISNDDDINRVLAGSFSRSRREAVV
jgi:CRP-like cAMP-binding protein